MQPFYHLNVSTKLNTEHFEANLPENMFVLHLFIYFYTSVPVKKWQIRNKKSAKKVSCS